MRDNIRGRIELIRMGKMPRKYMRTSIGVFPNDWKEICMNQCVTIASGLVDPRKNPYINMKHIGPENIEKDTGEIIDIHTASEQGLISGKYVFDNNSIIYSKVRPKLNKICMPDFSGICSADCYVLHVKDNIKKRYLYHYMMSDYFLKQVLACSMRTKMPKINQAELKAIKIFVPETEEQCKIMQLLDGYNKYINLLGKQIDEKKKQKRWLMEFLLTKKVKSLKLLGCRIKIRIGEFINEVSEKTNINNKYDVFSVTKTGIYLQKEQFNKKIASEDNTGYKVVRKGNLVFSTMNLWMGSLDVLEKYDIGIVSPAYKVFEFKKDKMLPEFGKYFMKSSYMIWLYNVNSEQGASVVRRNLDINSLMNTEVIIPDIAEQIKISKVLKCADKEIDLLNKKLLLVKKEKQAMMQLLLTGIVRVNEE